MTNVFYRNQNSPIVLPSYDSLGYANGYDLQQFYNNETNAFDNWLNYGNTNGLTGEVSTSYGFDLNSIASLLGYADFNEYYNTEYGF